MRALRARGGQRLLDRAFRNPPRTSAAVLDPARYLAGDPPAAPRAPAGRELPLLDHVRRRGRRRADRPCAPGARVAGRAPGRRAARPRPAPRDAPRAVRRSRPRAGSAADGRGRSRTGSSYACESCARTLQQKAFPADRDGVEPSPGRVEAESAAERRLHAVVDTLGLHVYSGETYPDGRFVTKVSLTPSMSLLGLEADGSGSDEQWVAAIHPDDRAALRGALQLRERAPPASARARIPPVRLRRRRALGLGAHLPAPPARGRRRRRRRRGRRRDGAARGHARAQRPLRPPRARARRRRRVRRLVRGPAKGARVWTHIGPGRRAHARRAAARGRRRPGRLVRVRAPGRPRRCSTSYLERLANREPAEATYRLRGLDGVERWVWSRAMPHPGDGPVVAYDAVITDVTERERARIGLQLAREEAERRSRVDPTTGLFNRHHLLDVARRELARAAREHTSPALVLLDVDRLRELNERRGHAVGDAVLRELAGRLSHSVRTYDTISHIGGGLLRGAGARSARRRGAAPHLRRDRSDADAGAAALGRPRAARHDLGGRRPRPCRHDGGCAAAHGRGRSRQGQGRRACQAAQSRTPAARRPPTSRARRRASLPRWPAPPPCAKASRASTSAASPSSPSSSAASSGSRTASRATCAWQACCTTSARSPSPARCSPSPARSTRQEWVVLREHPSIGADMVARIPGLARTQLAIRHHHERYRRRGLPRPARRRVDPR